MSTSTAEGTTVTTPEFIEGVEGEIVPPTAGPADTDEGSPADGPADTDAPEDNSSPATGTEVAVKSDLTAKQARSLADRIKRGLNGAADLTDRMNKSVEDAASLMAEAYSARIWLALDEPDWETFVAAELGEVRVRLERSVRQSLVYQMSQAAHMSTRAIAPVFGVDQKTVSNDLRQVRRELGTDAAPVAGKDGKTYEGTDAPKTRKPKPIEDRFSSALTKAETAVNAVLDLSNEDGFTDAAGTIAKANRADLAKMIDILKGIQDKLQ